MFHVLEAIFEKHYKNWLYQLIINSEIKQNTIRKAIKESSLLSGKIDKFEYLADEIICPSGPR